MSLGLNGTKVMVVFCPFSFTSLERIKKSGIARWCGRPSVLTRVISTTSHSFTKRVGLTWPSIFPPDPTKRRFSPFTPLFNRNAETVRLGFAGPAIAVTEKIIPANSPAEKIDLFIFVLQIIFPAFHVSVFSIKALRISDNTPKWVFLPPPPLKQKNGVIIGLKLQSIRSESSPGPGGNAMTNKRQQEKTEADREARRARRARSRALWMSVIAGLAALGVGIVWFAAAPSGGAAGRAEAGLIQISENDWIEGNPKAEVTLVEYSDFQCPSCGAYFPLLKTLSAEFSGRLRIVYRHFPLEFHAYSGLAAQAAEAAGKQGRFWEMHD